MKTVLCLLGPPGVGKTDLSQILEAKFGVHRLRLLNDLFNGKSDAISRSQYGKMLVNDEFFASRYRSTVSGYVNYGLPIEEIYKAFETSNKASVIGSLDFTLELIRVHRTKNPDWIPLVVYLQTPEIVALDRYLNKYPDNLDTKSLQYIKLYWRDTLEELQTMKLDNRISDLLILDATDSTDRMASTVINHLNVVEDFYAN